VCSVQLHVNGSEGAAPDKDVGMAGACEPVGVVVPVIGYMVK
jgi:hypothetical protein